MSAKMRQVLSYSYLKDRGAVHFLVWLIFFAICVVTPDRWLGASIALAFGLAIAFSLLALSVSSLRGPSKFLGVLCYVLVGSLVALVVLAYGINLRTLGPVEADAVRAIAQTDFFEALSYLKLNTPWTAIVPTLVGVYLLYHTFPAQRSLPPWRLTARYSFMVPVVLAAVLIFTGGLKVAWPIVDTFASYRHELTLFKTALAKRTVAPPQSVATDFDGTIIVIVGESTARHHMSLYDYFRDTTPRLLDRRDELIVFSDVVSNHSHTVPVLTNGLTLAGGRDDLSFESIESIDIVTLAKAAGYETHWLSNQNEYGVWDTPIAMLATGADQTRFFSPSVGETYRRLLLDEEMLPSIDAALSQEGAAPKAIFVHLFATHFPYCDAYPEAFSEFSGSLGRAFFGRASEPSDVDCYDNAVLYVDWLVDSIIEMAAASSEPLGVLYFSDHGEAPLLGTYHEARLHSAYHVEVPFLLWFNDSYKDRYGETVAAARDNSSRSYSLDRLFHSLGDLMQIETDLQEPSHSLLSSRYREQDRYLLDERISYDSWSKNNDYRENSRLFMAATGPAKPKIWAHRINSLGALMEAKQIFDGVELDLMFNRRNDRFHVFHPPAPDTGLTLGDMLAALKNRPEMRLWLDWKNVTADTLPSALARLEALDAEFGLKGRVMVETDSDATFEGIEQISAAGYKHGYYLPTNEILDCMANCSEEQKAALARKLEDRVIKGKFDAVTYDWRLRPFVTARLGAMIEQRGLEQFSWDMSIVTSRDISRVDEVGQRTEGLDGLLITFPSVFRI